MQMNKQELLDYVRELTVEEVDRIAKSELKLMKEETVKIIRAEARPILRSILIEEFEMKKMIGNEIIKLSANHFKPVVGYVYSQVYTRVTKHLTRTLTDQINLKTSDLVDLNNSFRKIGISELQLKNRDLQQLEVIK